MIMTSSQGTNEPSPPDSAHNINPTGMGATDSMPTSYLDRLLLYLDDMDAGIIPPQHSFDGWCLDCQANDIDFTGSGIDPVYLTATVTAEVRRFLQDHKDHSLRIYLNYEDEISDLDTKARSALLRSALYRRDWVAKIPDHELGQYPYIGPITLDRIRLRIPYSGAAENSNPAKPEPCPHCKGSGLRPKDTQDPNSLQVEGDEPLSTRELLTRLMMAAEQLNTRLDALEHSQKVSAPIPRLLLSYDEAAAALGLRVGMIWDAIGAGDLTFLRFGKGILRLRPEAIQEWLSSQELRIPPKEDPLQEAPIPPEKLCTQCGKGEIHQNSFKRKLCWGCERQWRSERRRREEQERIDKLSRNSPS